MNHFFIRRNLGWLWAIAIALLALTFPPAAAATGAYQMPMVSPGAAPWIIDEANLLSRLNEGKLSSQFEQLATDTGREVRLVTLHRLDYGETPASFADALFEKWFPTPVDQANQTLVVLDDVTNGAAVRSGEASATLLTEDIATSIAVETIGVPLREGNKYNQAFLDASDRIVAVLSGEPDPGPPVVDQSFEIEGTFATAEETAENRGNATIIVVGFLIAATVIPMATYYLYQSLGG
ncbi:photosystem II repair protein Psb32 [Leptolyngbya sp. PCC 6406]|uniref:photosystem II repair protein Psb32 n=1 Tax=Leptolyngbya sp. PCC 6406 TaxID=1173264 RepID=UPI0002ABD1B1|nr:TPM domain-containing protein [Leptolyngbya sp. PCC 6406]